MRFTKALAAISTTVVLASPVAALAATASTPLKVSQAAVATASAAHRVVTSADIARAALAANNVVPLYGLVSITGVSNNDAAYPRLEAFSSLNTADTYAKLPNVTPVCVNFPNSVGGAPSIVTCPAPFAANAFSYLAQQETLSSAKAAANMAYAASMGSGTGVSTANIMAAYADGSIKPVSIAATLKNGKGGLVKYQAVFAGKAYSACVTFSAKPNVAFTGPQVC